MKPRTLPATPEMKLARRRSTATTYQLYVPAALGGWANCTVNDQTGELSIHSDWGNWSYQWSPRPEHLGAEDLTEFLAKMPDAESDYVARKLQGGWNAGHRFDGEATAAEMVSVIAKHRLEHGRNAIERCRDYQDGDGAPYTIEDAEHDLDQKNSEHFHHLTASAARGLADAVAELGADLNGHGGNSKAIEAVFGERVVDLVSQHDAEWMFPEPWDHYQHTQTFDDKMLRDAVLPAMFAACRQRRIEAMLVAANGPQPAPEVPDRPEPRSTGTPLENLGATT